MNDYKAKQYLTELSQEIRQHTFWGLLPEMPMWDCTELGAYLPAISLPAFIQDLTIKNGVMSFTLTSYEQFTKHSEIYEMNATLGEFIVKLQAIIDSQTEKEFCQRLLEVLQTETYFVTEWDS